MGLVSFQRRYVVVLALAVVGLVASVVLSSGSKSAQRQATDRQLRSMEAAALKRLKVPSSWVPIQHGCPGGHCYLVAAPSSRVVAQVPGVLRASGIQPPGSLRAAEPVALLRASHWSTASTDPLVVACKTIHAGSANGLAVCQDAGRVGPTLINVLVGPYQPCHRVTCSDPGKTKVYAWSVAYPTGR